MHYFKHIKYVFSEGCSWEIFETRKKNVYYWACFPGCLPDGDEVGPFTDVEEAIGDIRDTLNSEDAFSVDSSTDYDS